MVNNICGTRKDLTDNVNVVAANVGGVFHTDINIFNVLVGVIDEHNSLATVSSTFFFFNNAFFSH